MKHRIKELYFFIQFNNFRIDVCIRGKHQTLIAYPKDKYNIRVRQTEKMAEIYQALGYKPQLALIYNSDQLTLKHVHSRSDQTHEWGPTLLHVKTKSAPAGDHPAKRRKESLRRFLVPL